ncbi:O-antigen polymerase [uncultured Tenacibaculum sp.]|uniref:O-antigen polymerase n=1 Tax=uncultured Tenacibaculum sp. TaxID=174713 RepID=UPI00261C8FDC|nr:O-antigen polymerase [uncultured Tenacibaculum sp.]
MELTLLILAVLFLIFLLNRGLKYYLLSPVYIYILFSVLSLGLSTLYFYYYEPKISLFNLDKVSEGSFFSVIKMYLHALVAFLIGAVIYYDLSGKKNKLLFNKNFTEYLFIKYKSSSSLKLEIIAPIMVFSIIGMYFLLYGNGIFKREYYINEASRGLKIIIQLLSFITVIILGLLNKKSKTLSFSLFFLLITISIGTGSRSTFLYYIVYVVLLFLLGGNTLFNKSRLYVNLIFGFIFLSFLTGLRMLKSHGLIPYLSSITDEFNGETQNIAFNIYYSFIFGVYVTIGTLKKAVFDFGIILTNLSPLPGRFTDWYKYADQMRLNVYAPFSLHGRVFKTGLLFTYVYFFLNGVIYMYFEKKIRIFLKERKIFLAILLLIFLCLYIVFSFEYNMRSAIRMIYYAGFILLIRYIYLQIIKNLPTK